MANSGRTVVAMLVGVALITLGCEDRELATPEPKPVQSQPTTPNSPQTSQPTAPPSSSAPELAWAEILEQNPDPKVVTDADFLRRITETKLPWRVKGKASGIEMLLVPPGKFVMGMSPGDSEARPNERPAHEVTITKPFYLGRTEVTVEQWVKLMGANPSKTRLGDSEPSQLLAKYINEGLTKAEANQRAGNHPAVAVSWDDCQKFCAKTGMKLPTEAQWEFACRAGLREPRYFENDRSLIAWFGTPARYHTHPVAELAPNALGFYDMLGNVSEWCEDWYDSAYYKSCEDGVVDPSGPKSGESRVRRGGSCFSYVESVRSSSRESGAPSDTKNYTGFRVARIP